MSKNNYFSIIIPTFNRREKLLKAVNSLLAQSYFFFEIIIIDDGSTDNTQSAIFNLFKENNFSEFQYIYQDNSGLPSIARNNGIKIAKHDWICFLDSDDFWTSDKLSVLNSYVNNFSKYNFFSHDEFLIDENNKVLKKLTHSPPIFFPYFYYLLIFKNFLSPSSSCIHKSLLSKQNGFNTARELYSVEDFDLWLRLEHCRIKHIPKTLGYYLIDGSGISSNQSKHIEALDFLYRSHMKLLKRKLSWPLFFIVYNFSMSQFYYIKSRTFYKTAPLISKKCLLKSIAHNPLNPKAWYFTFRLFLI